MKRVVVCSPYGGSIDRNLHYARCAVRHSIDQGEAPFASHLIYPQPNILDEAVPRDRERGIQLGLEWISLAEAVIFYVDHGWSPGMIQELKVARLFSRPIEVRHIYELRESPDAPPHVVKLLVDAGIVSEAPSPIEGVRLYHFTKEPKP